MLWRTNKITGWKGFETIHSAWRHRHDPTTEFTPDTAPEKYTDPALNPEQVRSAQAPPLIGTLLTKMQFLKVKYLIINKSSHGQAFLSKLADTLGAPPCPRLGAACVA